MDEEVSTGLGLGWRDAWETKLLKTPFSKNRVYRAEYLCSQAVNKGPHTVSIVLDRSYGSLLRELIEAGPVWAVESPTNREFTEQLRAESGTNSNLEGVTLFKASEARPPELMLSDWMDTIDLHHGVYSADPPYTVIQVIGTRLSTEGTQVLMTFGFDSFTETDEGFHAVRPLPARLELDAPARRN